MHVPRLDIVYALVERLDIQIEYLLLEKDEELDAIKSLCRELIYYHDFMALELAIEELNHIIRKRGSSCPSRKMLLKYSSWYTAIIMHKREGKLIEAKKLLEKLVEENSCINDIDIDILNTLGQIHLELNQFKDARRFLNKAYQMVSAKPFQTEDFTLYPRTIYYFALTLYYLKNYDEALELCYTVLYYLEANQLIYYRGELCQLIGQLLMIDQHNEEACVYLKKAELLFALEDKKEHLPSIAKEKV
ncbi:tetratricopeptide repeat protein [Bacillus xiapuensis]|uniref:tetratricopeptide repeat protein n=1 Tax=Bacillus xiapuensis TaxID=2014075 RepID=UPI000C240DD6|nr:tetratricopeptide repeat protein [Bacillus xiapuensis]